MFEIRVELTNGGYKTINRKTRSEAIIYADQQICFHYVARVEVYNPDSELIYLLP